MGGIISSVGNLLGAGGQGSSFQAQSAPIVAPTTIGQAQTAYGQAQTGLNSQQQLMNALAGQNGIQNQSNVYNQLQGVANGTGPNPAQAMLNQQTGANVANQAALMAGQRGAGANAGLIARQAAQQGGALQQQAVGQGATMQANQSLNALGQLGTLAGQQVNQQANAVQGYNQAAQNEQSNLLGGINAQNNANVSNTSNMNNANQATAANNAKQTAGVLGGIGNAIGGGLSSLFGGGSSAPATTGANLAANTAGQVGGSAIAETAGGAADAAGGSALGGLGDLLMLAAGGGQVPNPKLAQVPQSDRFPSANMPPHMGQMAAIYHPEKYAQGGKTGKVQAMVSPGETYLPPEKVKEVAKGGKNPLKVGEKIPGRPKVKGNSYENDTVPKKLEAGGVVIPNSIMQSEDPVGQASAFVKKLVEKGGGSTKEHGDFQAALKKAISSRKAS